MLHFLKIFYLISAIGSSLNIFSSVAVIRMKIRKLRKQHKGPGTLVGHPFYVGYENFITAPLHFRLLCVVIPLVNTFFTIFFVFVLYREVCYLYYNFGRWVISAITRDPDKMRFFKFKYYVMRIFFRRWEDYFFRRYEYDFIEKLGKLYIKKQKDEKEKSQSESEQTITQKKPESES